LLGRVGGVIHRPLSWPTRFEEDHVYRWELTSPQTSADLCGYWELLRPDLAVSEQDNGRFGAHPGARPTVELQWRTRDRARDAGQRHRAQWLLFPHRQRRRLRPAGHGEGRDGQIHRRIGRLTWHVLPRERVGSGVRHELGTHLEVDRSEEHTSELQSRFDLVCRRLLDK